ncbi:putative malate dehydrogenase 1B isoform X1 [Oryzias melastigma]|uniref:Malate dehydrogenase 1B, NAD (soluble) n=1 Tax=Oryzias melastigma TaxID=30732 RepID=A0A3B3BMC0_ORYME|nr:putative malate dehydrogenase 1B isoform X1 [Oryzias melastigma]
MAKFVVAGKADCPKYAEAERLADILQGSLPNFRANKICVRPDEWKGWLDATCRKNGWKHEDSPLIWRELVEQGGKGLLLGGYLDFLNHCKDYYGISSDVDAELMLSIAAENLEAQIKLLQEEQDRLRLIKPVHVWITGAASHTSRILIPNLLSAEIFPEASAISLHLLDVEENQEELQWLREETHALALSTLHQVTVHTDLQEAFREADVILLLDDNGEEEKQRVMRRYREFGRLIDAGASKGVKVIVSGDSYPNLRCLLLVESATSIDSHQFVAMATQLENEARAVIAEKINVRPTDVTEVIIWGNISGVSYIDLQRAKVFNFQGPIKGPAFFSQSLSRIWPDRKWLETDFQDLVRRRREGVTSKTGRAASFSAANGILRVLKAWFGGCGPGETLSAGVRTSGHFNLRDDVVFSVPVTFGEGKWSVVSDVTVGDELRKRLELCEDELYREKQLELENGE